MVFSLLYMALRAVFRLAPASDQRDREVEILVLRKLGIRVGASSIKRLLLREGLGPDPRRGPTWGEFLRSQAEGIWACDFFTVETAFLKTLYVLFFIEVGSRRVHVTAATRNPNGAFVTQQARNLCFELDEREQPLRFLIRDRDAKFSGPLDEVFRTEGVGVIRTPIRSPKANAFAVISTAFSRATPGTTTPSDPTAALSCEHLRSRVTSSRWRSCPRSSGANCLAA